MADSAYDGLNPEEIRIINDSLQTPPENWSKIASDIQQDLKDGKIGQGQSTPLQEVARLDRLIMQNLSPSNRVFPEYHIDGNSISFTAVPHVEDRRKSIGPPK